MNNFNNSNPFSSHDDKKSNHEIYNFHTIKFKHNENDYPNINGKHFYYEDLDDIRIASDVMMSPLDCLNPSIDTGITYMNCIKSNPEIEIFLPGLWNGFLDLDKALRSLKYLSSLSYKGIKFIYVIYNSFNGEILGFIIVDTPTYNKITNNSKVWTIDFCLTNWAIGYGIMSKALPDIFFLLQKNLNVNEVFFIVDTHNDRSINVMKRVFAWRVGSTFTEQDIEKKNPVHYFFKVDLSAAQFEGYS